MKKFWSLLTVFVLIVGLTACTHSTQPAVSAAINTTQATQSSAPVEKKLSGTIRFATWGAIDEKKVNEAIIAEFEKANPGCKVELEYIPEQYVQKIETMFMGGTAPDVIYGHPHYFAKWASEGLLMDLDNRFQAEEAYFDDNSKFVTSMYDAFKWEGKHIATINGSDTFLLFYNKDLFDKAGVSYPTDEWTWDDVVEAGKKLTNTTGDNKQYGITIPTWEVGANPIIFSFGGSIFDNMNNPTKVTFDNPDTVAALQFMQDVIYKDQIAPTPQGFQSLGGSFDTGKVAMDITGMWAVASRKNITDFKWDVANLPIRKGYPRKTAAFYAGYAIYKDTKNPDLAWEFAKYFQGDTAQTLLAKFGLITVINKQIASSDEVSKGPGMPEHETLRVSSVEYANGGYAFLTNLDEINANGIQPFFDKLLANTTDAATVAKDAQAELEKIFAQSKKQ